jgi:hypothetical protein
VYPIADPGLVYTYISLVTELEIAPNFKSGLQILTMLLLELTTHLTASFPVLTNASAARYHLNRDKRMQLKKAVTAARLSDASDFSPLRRLGLSASALLVLSGASSMQRTASVDHIQDWAGKTVAGVRLCCILVL